MPTTALRPAITPGTLRGEVRRIVREQTPGATVEFTSRARTVTFPTGAKAYEVDITVNGKPLTAHYAVNVGRPSVLSFRGGKFAIVRETYRR